MGQDYFLETIAQHYFFRAVSQCLVAFRNSIINAVIIFLGLMVINDHVFAQSGEKGTGWMISIGAGGGRFYVLDKKFSSIPYTGYGWKGDVSIRYLKGKSLHELAATYAKGHLKTSSQSKSDAGQVYFDGGYLNLHDIGRDGKKALNYKAGGSLHFLYAKRNYNNFINNKISFEFAASVSGVLQISYSFKNRLEGFSVSNRITVPIISSVVQPAFDAEELPGDINNNGSGENGFINSNHIVGFRSFTRVKNQLSLDKIFSSGQKLSFAYTWDYYQFLRQREVKQAVHSFGLTYTFILL